MEFPFIKPFAHNHKVAMRCEVFFNMMLYNFSSQDMCIFCPSHYILFLIQEKATPLQEWVTYDCNFQLTCFLCVCVCVCFKTQIWQNWPGGGDSSFCPLLIILLCPIFEEEHFFGTTLYAHLEWGIIGHSKPAPTKSTVCVGWMICGKKTFFHCILVP